MGMYDTFVVENLLCPHCSEAITDFQTKHCDFPGMRRFHIGDPVPTGFGKFPLNGYVHGYDVHGDCWVDGYVVIEDGVFVRIFPVTVREIGTARLYWSITGDGPVITPSS